MTVNVTPIFCVKVGNVYVPQEKKHVVPVNWAPEFEYPLTDIFISLRLTAMYKCLLTENWVSLRRQTGDLLQRMKKGNMYVCKEISDILYAEMLHILVEIAFKKKDSIHDRIRNLYFAIESKYFMQ